MIYSALRRCGARPGELCRATIDDIDRTVPNLTRTYSRLRDLAGLSRDLELYLARHECGTKICREKGIEYARRLLGHSNFSTTQQYLHLDERELAEVQDLLD